MSGHLDYDHAYGTLDDCPACLSQCYCEALRYGLCVSCEDAERYAEQDYTEEAAFFGFSNDESIRYQEGAI